MSVQLQYGKGKDVGLYSAFHAPGTPNVHTSLKLTRQTATVSLLRIKLMQLIYQVVYLQF